MNDRDPTPAAKPPPWPKSLSSDERANRAKDCVEETVKRVREVIDLDEQTERVCVDDTLRSSVPAGSHALSAFDQLRFSLYWFKVIQLISLWDPEEENSYSIPTVLRLIDDDDVVAALARATHDHFAALEWHQWIRNDDPDLQAEIDRIMQRDIAERARNEADQQRELIQLVIKKAKRRKNESTTSDIRNARHYVAHHIEHTRKEANMQRDNTPPLDPPKYQDVASLLSTTVKIAQDLYLAVNGNNYDMNEVRRISAKNAEALWGSCRFDGA